MTAGLIDSGITQPKEPDALPALDAPIAPAPSDQTPGITPNAVPKAATYDAALGAVNQPTDTTAGQLDTLLKSDNPYITRARAAAAQVANSRGLLNSSMAAGAGEAAAIDAALPIASQDAAAYGTQRLTNQAASNTAGQFNTGQQNTLTQQAQQGDIQARIQQLQGQIQSGLIGETGTQTRMTQAQAEQAQKELATLQGEIQTGLVGMQEQAAEKLAAQTGEIQTKLQQLKGTQATDLANIEANYKTLMQSSASASQLYTQVVQTIGALLDDPNTTAEQKQAAVDKQIQLLQGGLAVIGAAGNVDLGSLLDFSGIVTPGVAGTPAATPAAPAPTPVGQQGQPAPAGTPGAGHNVGDKFFDPPSGHTYQVNADGSTTDLGGP